ncbi:8-amino-7-oxononanoate synthase [Halothiobacillus diazotrophicus]|uniref:8-amino-7-oxononanoate synthase n=1 Tax=Halothiobacillus diazotrophicus TaxID=1860122 RepID=A0A191ZIJ4_9GAMM|nr:8-amino-7-oxononanoate synthase [Halothiobacillus diazotrophicus]ANJ67685.1 8-amino-7-oxononanoate synthase [Halothiobacillus diazotrophicus]
MRDKIITTRDWTQWLSEREDAGLTRRLRLADSPQDVRMQVDGRSLLTFCSNDYLGLARHPEVAAAMQAGIARWGVGAGAAHLVNGHFGPHDELERALAEWLRVDRALLFSTGYMANLAVVGGLVGRGDTVIADRLNHASLVDAAQLSGAKLLRYRHGDMADARRQLARASGTRMILTDGVFSMDGDVAPLTELMALAAAYDAWLVVDDAHGFGVWGESGRGSLSASGLVSAGVPEYLIQVGTLGKAFGTAGAFVAGGRQPIEVLLQRARSYLFTTAQPPSLACATLASLNLIRHGDSRRAHLQGLIARLRDDLAGIGLPVLTSDQMAVPSSVTADLALMPSTTPIQPLWVGDSQRALALSRALETAGLLVPAIRPPTVPAGSARLRVTLSAAHAAEDVAQLVAAIEENLPCG